MKQIPNLITGVRLLAAITLIILSVFDKDLALKYFLMLFCMAGVSDMLDGFIARRFNWCTEFGARLDSISDLCLYLAVVTFLALHATSYLVPSYSLLASGLALQLFHWALAQRRHGAYPAYHSTFSRVCAYAMFFTMLAFWNLKEPYLLSAMMFAWIACSCEGIAITIILNRCITNVSSIRSALSFRNDLSGA
jgi:phosphatidylglycerophosphate synthase